jgi:alkanesulfonate monooxygenase SsuD/methylene tetrahydromethanopterin reductase-like flavin-dependent oxidoreductase (luciferase family)
MQLGIILGDVDVRLSAREHLDRLLRLVEAAQKAGLKYLSIGQHFLYQGQRWLQPVPTLARLAAEVDADTRLVTTVLLAPLYHPVVLAEELATLDVVTGGRLIAGLGLGYRQSEYASLGVPFEERAGRFEEALEVMAAMWTSERVDFRGRFFDVHGPVHVRPWQTPRPPVWIGADSPAGVRRAARAGDAWIIGPTKQVEDIRTLLAEFDAQRAERKLAPAVHPIRRDLAPGPDRATAIRDFLKQTAARYRTYVENERPGYEPPDSDRLAARVLHGTVDDCVEQLRDLSAQLPVNPVIVRPDWPGMSTDHVVEGVAGLAELAAAAADIPVGSRADSGSSAT